MIQETLKIQNSPQYTKIEGWEGGCFVMEHVNFADDSMPGVGANKVIQKL